MPVGDKIKVIIVDDVSETRENVRCGNYYSLNRMSMLSV
jgi:hypothetical protein